MVILLYHNQLINYFLIFLYGKNPESPLLILETQKKSHSPCPVNSGNYCKLEISHVKVFVVSQWVLHPRQCSFFLNVTQEPCRRDVERCHSLSKNALALLAPRVSIFITASSALRSGFLNAVYLLLNFLLVAVFVQI